MRRCRPLLSDKQRQPYSFCTDSATGRDLEDPRHARPNVQLPAEIAGLDNIVRTLVSVFDHADILALGESDQRTFDSDLRIRLVRHPDFARQVGVIVVEFENTADQATLDRYVRGDDVPVAALDASQFVSGIRLEFASQPLAAKCSVSHSRQVPSLAILSACRAVPCLPAPASSSRSAAKAATTRWPRRQATGWPAGKTSSPRFNRPWRRNSRVAPRFKRNSTTSPHEENVCRKWHRPNPNCSRCDWRE
jgi:hypothetical protein